MIKSRIPAIPLLILSLLVSFVPSSVADTIVGGMIGADTVWSIEGSPYIASQSVPVMSGAKLTIEPGVTVKFYPDTALTVTEGTLIARGTAESNIAFTAFGISRTDRAGSYSCGSLRSLSGIRPAAVPAQPIPA